MKSAFGCVACYFGEAGAHDSGLVDLNAAMLPNVTLARPGLGSELKSLVEPEPETASPRLHAARDGSA
jgi:hypothetical protein